MAAIDASPSAEDSLRRLKGIGLMCLALFCFACLDTTAKYLGRTVPPLEVTFFRYAVAGGLVGLIFNPWRTPSAWRSRRPVLQALRGLALLGSTLFNFAALMHLQLAETMSIAFAAPLLIALMAGPLLGEWVGPRRWAAIMVGFSGVLVVARPGLGGLDPYIGLSFASVFCGSVYAITTRMLSGVDSPASMLVFSCSIAVVVVAPIMPFVWVWPSDPFTWLLLISTGLYGAVGHYFLIRAYEFAPAPVAAPFTYTQIVWMVALGYLVFGDVPGLNTMLGAGIVIASGIYLLMRERVVKSRERAAAAGTAAGTSVASRLK